MKICPLMQKECVKEGCEWWASGINRCTTIALGILIEEMHDMGVMTFKEFVQPPEEEEPVTE